MIRARTGSRISVVGTTGAGKTTVAQEIARRLDIPHIELDALHWEGNWQGVDDAVLESRVKEAVSRNAWVVDGNYSRIRPLVWSRADTVVFLDYSFFRVLWQLIIRTLRRSLTGEELWAGNRESLSRSLISRDSILLWMLTTFHRRRRQYRALFDEDSWEHLQVFSFSNPGETSRWLKSLDNQYLKTQPDQNR